MSFMTGLEIWKSKIVKTDGESEENLTVCMDTHQHGSLKSVENGYYLKAAGCLWKYWSSFSSLVFLWNSYRLKGGNSQFTINPSTGQIITSALLDREARENYTLVVVASDGGFPRALSSSASVLVSVADVNDNPPKFQHHPYVTHVPSPTTSGNIIAGSAWMKALP